MQDSKTFKRVLKALSREAGWDILNVIAKGPARFMELEATSEVSPRTLSERLKELAELELINRKAFAEVPPRVEYTLTVHGQRVLDALNYLLQALS